MKKVVIVGAGPAGLFAAYEIAGKADVVLIEKGKNIEERLREKDILHGIGGAGLFSDGKFIFSEKIGTNLPEIVGNIKTRRLVEKIENILKGYGIRANNSNSTKEKEIATKAAQHGIEYITSRQAHIGTDCLPAIIGKFFHDIEKKINVRCEENVVEIEKNKVITEKNEYKFDKLLLAVGRSGAKWLENILKKNKIEYTYNPVDIGVRVELPSLITENICKVDWDFKARIHTKTYQDFIRTFCVCPYGHVEKENYENFCLVNGHSRKDEKSENTNFAFLVSWKLTEPVKSGNEYGETIARKTTFIGGGMPIIQRLGDLRRGRRSTWERINSGYVVPTLKEVTPGDIGSALEYRFVLDILEGLEVLNKLVPGVADDSSLLYCPEIKFHGIRPKTNEYLQTSCDNIYVAGDGAGLSRGIVGAACSGLLAAEGILKE